jgi:membrane fusion protein (multidrug efflux system)
MKMKKIIGIVVVLAIVALVVFKLKSNKEITKNKVYTFDKEQAINIQAETLSLENVNTTSSFSGTFEPNKETKVSAETQGKINSILVDVGYSVKKGQTLVQIDNSLLKLQVQSIDTQIEGLNSDVIRYTILAKSDAIQGVQLEKAELGLKTAKIQRATIIEQINKTIVKAPFDGIVTAKLSEEGAFAAPGVPLLQITDIKTLKFTVNISENDLKSFNLNESYSISTDVYAAISLKGKILMIGSKANMGSSFPIQFSVNNTSDLKIKSGMFGKVLISSKKNEKGIIISTSSIVGSETNPKVYLVKNGKAKLQNIKISSKMKNKAVISNGLKEGDVIVKQGFINLFDGANVLIIK